MNKLLPVPSPKIIHDAAGAEVVLDIEEIVKKSRGGGGSYKATTICEGIEDPP